MAIVQGAWASLLSPGLKQAFMKAYVEKVTGTSDIMLGQPTPVRELHVVDLGEGMLVPVQMLRDLFA